MPDMSERIEHMMRTVEEQANKASELRSAVENARGTATSADRSVTVTAAPSGAVLDLQLSPQVSRQSHTVIQKTILATIRDAAQRASEQLNDAAATLLGDQFGQFQHVLDAATGTAGKQPNNSPRRPEPFPDDEDDFQNRSYLR